MRRHSRSQATELAAAEMRTAIIGVADRHLLTEAEIVRVVNDVASGIIARLANQMLRAERHPGQPDKPADIA